MVIMYIIFNFSDPPVQISQDTKKSVVDNTNEIIILKNKISDLEQKLSISEIRKSYRRRFNSESQELIMENQIVINGGDRDQIRQ